MTADIDSLRETPWHRCDWRGNLVSIDGASTVDFVRADVARVVAYGETILDAWDGECAGIVQLHDGRFVAWESNWGPTGSGFCRDAYGGDADIGFATTEEAARSFISEKSRELFR